MGNPKIIPLKNKKFGELNPLECGEEICSPEHSYGPAIRRYTLIHYVISGKGILTNSAGEHSVSAGEAFIITPGEVTVYTADKENPWHYIWVGFDGALSGKFSELPTVIAANGKIFRDLMSASEFGETTEEYIASKLFEFYARLFSQTSGRNDYVLRIINYVETNYNANCDVSDIANALNLERHYLSRLFRNETGKTLKNFILEKRMAEAKNLLADGNTVAYSAAMSGYKDQFLFSKMFKKMYGVSPKVWRDSAADFMRTKSSTVKF